MITLQDGNQISKVSSDVKVDASPDEPPPSYSARVEPGSSGAPAFKTKPTNFLALSTKDSTIRGEFVIEPSMRIPSSMLLPVGENETEEDRKNLSLMSHHSSVEADVWLLPSSPLPSKGTMNELKPRRTTIALASNNGSIRTQLHTLEGAAPFLLTARTAHGSVRLALPRSFHGFLSVSTRHGSISLSDTLLQNATQFSQVEDVRRYFIGNFHELEDAWEGDQIEIEAPHGSIRLKYFDEGVDTHGKKGLLSRLFGK